MIIHPERVENGKEPVGGEGAYFSFWPSAPPSSDFQLSRASSSVCMIGRGKKPRTSANIKLVQPNRIKSVCACVFLLLLRAYVLRHVKFDVHRGRRVFCRRECLCVSIPESGVPVSGDGTCGFAPTGDGKSADSTKPVTELPPKMEPITTSELEEASRLRENTKQKVCLLRDTVLNLQQPTLQRLTSLKASLWKLYGEYNKFHGFIIGSVPEEALAEQYTECESFDQLFNEAGVPLEEKLIALRSNTAAEPSTADNIEHQPEKHPWKSSVPTVYRISSWSTPMASWESVRKELRGRTDNRARSQTLEAEVGLRNHSPPTSYSNSHPEHWSRPQNLEADTALRSRIPPTNGPRRRSKPTSASDVLEFEVVMRDLFPPIEPNTTSKSREPITAIPEPNDQTDLRAFVNPRNDDTGTDDVPPSTEAVNSEVSRTDRTHPGDRSLTKFKDDPRVAEPPTAAQAMDNLYNPDTSLTAADSTLEEEVDNDKMAKATSSTPPRRLATSNKGELHRASTDGEVRMDTTEPLPAVKLPNTLDHPTPEPQLPAAAKAPDKDCQLKARRGRLDSDLHEFQKKQDNIIAAEDPRDKIDLSPKNQPRSQPPNETLQQAAHREPRATMRTSCDLPEAEATVNERLTQNQLKVHKSETVPPTEKSTQPERRIPKSKYIHSEHPKSPKKRVRTIEALESRPQLNRLPGLPLRWRLIFAVYRTCLKGWIPDNLPKTDTPACIPRSSNRYTSRGRERLPRNPIINRDGERTPTNEAEPSHRKCSVGKRKLNAKIVPRPSRTCSQTTTSPRWTICPNEAILLSGLNGGSMFRLTSEFCPSRATRNPDAHALTAQPFDSR
ncbi:hypothetical protein pipiens_008651 [Culex pipiens pipiens]|uniref:Uncharacterized protein n=1 Tax=Culex pipiens pipiens TaxID=38569 RepID=A0ABD1DGN0_CULPP